MSITLENSILVIVVCIFIVTESLHPTFWTKVAIEGEYLHG